MDGVVFLVHYVDKQYRVGNAAMGQRTVEGSMAVLMQLQQLIDHFANNARCSRIAFEIAYVF